MDFKKEMSEIKITNKVTSHVLHVLFILIYYLFKLTVHR